jgi:hypothetical protein
MSYVQVPADSVGKRVDTVTLTDAGVEVHRQKLVVTGGSGTAEVVVVTNAAAAAGDMGLVVRHAGTATVAGTVNVNGGVAISGTAVVAGSVVISGTAQVALGTPIVVNNISATSIVAGVVGLTAGTAVIGDINAISRTVQVAVGTPFTIQNISATTIVAGVVGLTAGTANIGNLDFISRTVQVAVGTPFTLQGISTTVQVAIATPFTINNISATSQVAGTLNVSGSVVVSGSVNLFTTAEHASASRGPRCTAVSTSANAVLASAPGAGLSIFVTQIAISNASGTNTRGRLGSSATPNNVQMMMAQSGGGFVMNFTPPWQISANEHLVGSVKPNVSEGIFNVHFFVASADAL